MRRRKHTSHDRNFTFNWEQFSPQIWIIFPDEILKFSTFSFRLRGPLCVSDSVSKHAPYIEKRRLVRVVRWDQRGGKSHAREIAPKKNFFLDFSGTLSFSFFSHSFMNFSLSSTRLLARWFSSANRESEEEVFYVEFLWRCWADDRRRRRWRFFVFIFRMTNWRNISSASRAVENSKRSLDFHYFHSVCLFSQGFLVSCFTFSHSTERSNKQNYFIINQSIIFLVKLAPAIRNSFPTDSTTQLPATQDSFFMTLREHWELFNISSQLSSVHTMICETLSCSRGAGECDKKKCEFRWVNFYLTIDDMSLVLSWVSRTSTETRVKNAWDLRCLHCKLSSM